MLFLSILPNLEAFAAIGTNVDVLSTGHQLFSKLLVIIVVPGLLKTLGFKVAELVGGNCIEAAGYHQPIPR